MPPSWGDLRKFCSVDDWTETTSGRKDHFRYVKTLPDGSILRTRASHGNDEIGDPGLWSRIWRHQLGLDNEQAFWDVLQSGEPVPRVAAPTPQPPEQETQDASLVNALIYAASLPEDEVRKMSNAEMQARWDEFVADQ